MRTTVTLEPDVAAAVEALRRRRHVGVSAAVNEMIRTGLAADQGKPAAFVQRSSPMRARLDVANVAEALELLDGPPSP